MKFYCYLPRPDGSEPTGTNNRFLFKMDSLTHARKHTLSLLGTRARLYFYTNFFDRNTFTEICLI